MTLHDRKVGWPEKLSGGAPLAVLLAAGLLVVYRLLPVLELVAVAMLLALVVRTPLNRLHEAGLRPWMSVSVLLAVFAAFGAFIWLIVAPNVAQEVHTLTSRGPGYVDSLTRLSRWLHAHASFVPDGFQVSERLKNYLDQAISSLPNLLLEVSHAVAKTVAILILAVFMSYDPGALISGGLRFVPPERRDGAKRLITVLEERLRGWMVGAGLAMLFVGTGAGIGLWLLGAPLPITFGLLAGLLNVVPYVGSIVGAVLPALLALTISPVQALLVVVLFAILNQIDGYVIQPLVMGREVRLHPVSVLLAFLVLGRLLGAVGLILAVPALVFLTTIADELLPREAPEDGGTLPAVDENKSYDSIPS